MATNGWDSSRRQGASEYEPHTWHWYERGGPICGTTARSSLVTDRREKLPDYARRVCKRCRAKLKKRAALHGAGGGG